MNEHDATELAFKNGYKKAVTEVFEELEEYTDIIYGDIEMSRYDFCLLKKKYTEDKT